jgi:hypothetical protein
MGGMRDLVCDRCAEALGGKEKCELRDGWNCALRMYSGRAIEALREEIDRVSPGARRAAQAALPDSEDQSPASGRA